MSWIVAAAANGVIALAYFVICSAILRGLIRTQQVWRNRLGLATALIFFTCGVHHGSHSVHMLLPSFGIEVGHGTAMRLAFDWHQAAWDVVTAAVAVYYWTLRSSYGALLGPTLFEDVKAKQRQALEINDDVVQGLAVAQMALESGDIPLAREAVAAALTNARHLISGLLGEVGHPARLGPGDLVRVRPAEAVRRR